MATRKNILIGQRFGRLVVLEEANIKKDRQTCWICKCDCGTITNPIRTFQLTSGRTQSCGCLKRERVKEANTKHSKCNTRLYRIWTGMKRRCEYTKSINFQYYGGRGIAVCDEWCENFQAFYEWAILNGYDDNLTIDRIDTNGDYTPQNCQWITLVEQQKNRRPRRKKGKNKK